MRTFCGAVVLAGALLLVAGAGEPDPLSPLGQAERRKEKPYPYPVAVRFGFQYREESLKEDAWQTQFYGRHPGAPAGLGLTRFYPRYPDTEAGAVASWRERRQTMPFVYLAARSGADRQPTEREKELEREGWVAGYLESARRHPAPD
jgi:hypothetical protein